MGKSLMNSTKIKNLTYHENELFNSNNYSLYDVKITKLGNFTHVKQYDTWMLKKIFKSDIDRLNWLFDSNIEIITELETKLRTYSPKGSVSNEIRSDSYIRSFEILRNLALSNIDSWNTFITLTIAENISNSDIANRYLKQFVNNVKKDYPQFKYLAVPERQGRGAIHYHLLTNIKTGSNLLPLRPIKKLWNPEIKSYINLEYYNIKYWKHGFSSAFDLDKTDENFSIIAYLAKYFWKQKDDHFFGRKKILHSNNLEKPQIEFMSQYSKAFDQYKSALQNMIMIRKLKINSKSIYRPDFEIKEYKQL
jgi:hypothetical protein